MVTKNYYVLPSRSKLKKNWHVSMTQHEHYIICNHSRVHVVQNTALWFAEDRRRRRQLNCFTKRDYKQNCKQLEHRVTEKNHNLIFESAISADWTISKLFSRQQIFHWRRISQHCGSRPYVRPCCETGSSTMDRSWICDFSNQRRSSWALNVAWTVLVQLLV